MCDAVLLNILNDQREREQALESEYRKDFKLEEKLSGSKALQDTE